MLGREALIHYLKQNGYNPQTVRGLLATRTVISGRSMNVGQVGDLYMLMFHSIEGAAILPRDASGAAFHSR